MLDHAFSTMGLHRVSLAVFSFNERAIRSYEKVGFVVEGRAREAIFRDGRFWDEISMSMLATEWRALQAAPVRRGSSSTRVDASATSAASSSGGQ
jgi:RimJ/RimL family protein N-acetyltransferase